MAKDILIYGGIHALSAGDFITAVDDLDEGEPLSVRINTPGGDPQASFGMISKIQEFDGEKIVRVDGQAYSAGFFLCCFADRVEALDVSRFMVHRAAFPEWFEQSDNFTDEMRGELAAINKTLMEAMKKSIDVKKFEAITGKKIKEIFSMDGIMDVFLTAQQAKQIGLIQKITKITPAAQHQISLWNQAPAIAAVHYDDDVNATAEVKIENQNQNKMTKDEFKKANPEAFAAMQKEAFDAGSKAGIEAGSKAGIEAEQKRVADWTEHISVDAEAVKAGIESGDPLEREQLTALIKKSVTTEGVATIEAEGTATADAGTTEPIEEKVEQTDGEKAMAEFEAKVDAKLNLKKAE